MWTNLEAIGVLKNNSAKLNNNRVLLLLTACELPKNVAGQFYSYIFV